MRAAIAALPQLTLVPGHDLGGLPEERDDVVWHHPEYRRVDAWPLDPGR